MAKGSASKHRPGDNGRAGLRSCPPGLRRELEEIERDPSRLDTLPEHERALRAEQLAVYRNLKFTARLNARACDATSEEARARVSASDFARRGHAAALRARRLKRERVLEIEKACIAEMIERGTPTDQWMSALRSTLRDLGIRRGRSAIYRDLEALGFSNCCLRLTRPRNPIPLSSGLGIIGRLPE
jgi:hypothetical protein